MIEYKDEPLAGLYPLTKTAAGLERLQLWIWFPLWMSNDIDVREWHKTSETVLPVLLAFSIESSPAQEPIPMLNPFPLPQIGEYGLVETSSEELIAYNIQDLPLESRQRWVTLGDALRKLSEPLEWPRFSKRIEVASNETLYHNEVHSIASQRKLTIGQAKMDLIVKEALFLAARSHVQKLQSMLSKPTLVHQWEEVRRMASNLAQDYYSFHEKKHRGYIPPLPAMTSLHQTTIPSSQHARGLAQSFGPYVARSLWNTEDNTEQMLTTPNGATLTARGENEHEQRALHTFIEGGMGAEGIKYMVSLLAAYHAQTNAVNRKDDARTTLRQLLIFMGRSDKHADDLEEQRKLMHYILYLSRTWVTAKEKIETPAGRGRRKEGYREYTPLVVLEALSSDVRGGIRIPDAIEFHLGKEFWEQMFGKHQHFFTIPTSLILRYHSVRQQQEICLALYLANMLNLNSGIFPIHFPKLLIETGLQGQADIDQSTNRTRDALRNIYALEQLERDNLITRDAHPDIDTVLAAELYSKAGRKEDISDATLTRIYNAYRHFQALSSTELKTRRRIALQHLLDTVENNTIKFRSGPLINGQIEKRTQGRQLAIEKREQAQRAGLAKRKSKVNHE